MAMAQVIMPSIIKILLEKHRDYTVAVHRLQEECLPSLASNSGGTFHLHQAISNNARKCRGDATDASACQYSIPVSGKPDLTEIKKSGRSSSPAR